MVEVLAMAKNERIFWDERGYLVTQSELYAEFLATLKERDNGITFGDYLRNCCDKNGTLTELMKEPRL